MSLIRSSMSKKRLLLILVLLGLGAGAFYWALRCSDVFTKLKSQKVDYLELNQEHEKMGRQFQELKNNYEKLQSDFAVLSKEKQNISSDRDNVLVQAKSLLGERARAQELQENLDKTKKDNELLRQERQRSDEERKSLLGQNQGLTKKLQELQAQFQDNFKERTKLQDLLAREKDQSVLVKLEKYNAQLQKEKTSLAEQLKKQEQDTRQLKEELSKAKDDLGSAAKEMVNLRAEIENLNKNYTEAVRKNAILQRKITDSPKKFAELARQNLTLIKQTANMHYNLGVFYLKSKEYTRSTAELEKAVELNPDDAYAHFNLGYIYAEYLVNRPKAIEHFRHYLRLAKKDDKDVDWVKKYLLTWQSYTGKEPMQ